MLISFTCSQCQCRMEIDASAMGTEVDCPECHARAPVPKVPVGPGVTLGGFKIEKLIGVGGMGEVYLARQIVMDRHVALKVLPSQAAHSKDEVAQFLHEIRLLARLEHPNIVTAHEAGQDSGVLYLAMAYVKGESLDQHLRRKGYVPEKDALKLVRKVAKALAYAWNEHRLLHRDIKPSNILLDPHGEPRLADLGLSQSLKHRQPTGRAGLVLGTPNYMSPEQAEGRESLDFRTDMYALGATLYHMLTGQLPFEAATVEETIRKKVQEPLPDPRTFNPALTPACVTLMAKMLSREPDERHASWEELIADFDLVLAGKPDGAARAADYKAKISAAASESRRKKKPEEKPWALVLFLIVLAIAAVAAVIWAVGHNAANPASSSPPQAGPASLEPEAGPKPPPEHRAGQERLARNRAQFEEIKQWADKHPAEFPELRVRLDSLLKRAAGTPLEEEILKELETRMAARDQARQAALSALWTNIAPLIAAGDYPGAIGTVTNYTGPFAAETVKERDARASELVRLGAEAELKKAAAEGAWAKLKGVCAAHVIAQDYEGALAALDKGCREAALNPTNAPIARWQTMLARCGRMREAVLASYQADAGKTVEIALLGGVESWEIRGVAAGVIQAQRTVAGRGTISRDIRYEELHAAEKYRRLEREAAPMRDILRGLLAWQTGNVTLARRHFESTGEDFGQALAEALSGTMKQSSEAAAEKAFGLVLRKAGLTPGAEPAEDMARRIRRARFGISDISAIRAAAVEFRQNYGGSDTAARNAAILSALEKVSTFPREVDTSVVDQTMRALSAANAGAGDLRARCRMTDDGMELDLSACEKVVQIGPIGGLPLVRVNLAGTKVRDLSALRSTPVQALDLSGCPRQDLGQLHGLQTVKELALCDSGVESISDLRGLQLESLNLASNRVTNLSPLAGMPLKKLVLISCPVENLKSLQNLPLEYLDISGCERLTDLKPLRGMPLTVLRMVGSPVTDLSPLKDCPLKELFCRICPNLKDLSPVHGMSTLHRLGVDGLRLTDLDFVEGLPLEWLSVQDNPQLRALLPLKGMPLKTLRVSRTGIATLAPLAGMPLTNLVVAGCENLTDLRPLMECRSLTTLVAAKALIRPYLREHPALKEIGPTPDNLYPVAEVWRMMDAAEGRRGAAAPAEPPAVTNQPAEA